MGSLLPKPVRLLRALFAGNDVTSKDGYVYRIEDGHLVVVGHDYDTKEEVLLGADMTLNGFIKWAEELSEEELFILGCQTVLKNML